MRVPPRFTPFLIALTAAAALPLLAGEAPADESPSRAELAPRFSQWLEEVDPLITSEERTTFLELHHDYQRDAFIREFWRVRDPYTETARNELKERYLRRVDVVRNELGGFDDDRSRLFLVHGPPAGVLEVRCTTTRKPAEAWFYDGSELVDFRFLVVFLRPRGVGPARIWRPTHSASVQNVIASSRACINGSRMVELIRALAREGTYPSILDRVLIKPRPRSEEWVASFASYTTDVAPDADRFDADVAVDHLGRHQHRTVTQVTVRIPRDVAGIAEFAGYRSWDFQLTGEVVTEVLDRSGTRDQLLESFRYKFGFPVDGARRTRSWLPLVFQRFLRPGEYRMVLKVTDLNTQRVFQKELELDVPRKTNPLDVDTYADPETARIFEEATAAVARGETTIRIIPPLGDLHTGFLRFDTLTTGADVDEVAFFLDDRRVLTKTDPPFNVELDLGAFPRLRPLRVEALDEEGNVLAEDELLLNAGGQRFEVRLVEPRKNRNYEDSLRAHAEVDIPEGRTLERVEFFLNEALVATLYQEPFVQPIALPASRQISYVRAMAYLTDGNSTEDLVFVNAPDYLEEVDVQFVELYAAVLDKAGRPIEGLESHQFEVYEDGRNQEILRFKRVKNLPIHVGILVDNSASMAGVLEEARKAALSFFQQAINPRDRAAVITFNKFPHLAVKLTSNLTQLGGGLAGLTAEGQTALYDSLMFGLYYFTGIKGQRALLLLSDGKDESSRFDFEDTLEYARRAGVTIYSIGLDVKDGGSRRKLTQLSEETGGRTYFTRDIGSLQKIYESIQEELRSQYLIAYQSTNTSTDPAFRSIDLKVDRSGAQVKTMSGYYP